MFESHLAPASGATPHRDLSSLELWEVSLERSRHRRDLAARHRRAAPKTKATAAAMSTALLVSPVLPMASAAAQVGGAATTAARQAPPRVSGVIVERGDVGGMVAEVQRKVGVDDDGIFGPITEDAVGDFQRRAGLPRTGIVDTTTWKALFRATISFVPSGSASAKRIVAELPARPAAPRRVADDREGGGTPPAGVNLESDEPDGGPVPLPEPPAAPAPAPAGQCGGPIVTPAKGTVTSTFGDGRNHAGVDIAAPTGTAVRAAGCGTVTQAGSESGYGSIVCIQHSSTFSTCYAHLSQIGVQQGAYVQVGQVIGAVGSTGRSTGPHLHFETRVNGRAQDPEPYLKGGRTIPGRPAKAPAGSAKAAQARAATSSPAASSSGGAQAAGVPQAQAAAPAPQQSAPAPQESAAPQPPAPEAAAPQPAPAPEAAAPQPAPAPDAAAPAQPAPVASDPAPAVEQAAPVAAVPEAAPAAQPVQAEAPGIVPAASPPSAPAPAEVAPAAAEAPAEVAPADGAGPVQVAPAAPVQAAAAAVGEVPAAPSALPAAA